MPLILCSGLLLVFLLPFAGQIQESHAQRHVPPHACCKYAFACNFALGWFASFTKFQAPSSTSRKAPTSQAPTGFLGDWMFLWMLELGAWKLFHHETRPPHLANPLPSSAPPPWQPPRARCTHRLRHNHPGPSDAPRCRGWLEPKKFVVLPAPRCRPHRGPTRRLELTSTWREVRLSNPLR